MSKYAFAAVAVMVAGTTAAQAADLPYRSRAPYTVNQPLNAYSWAGPYLGATLGYEWGSVSNTPVKPTGIVGGITAGYNWQSGPIVFGIEGDISGTGADDRFANYKFSNPWFGTARGRLGYAFNNVLLYGTAGLSFGSLQAEANGLQQSQTSVGWTAGVGAEVGIYQNWTAKIEYLYVDLSRNTYTLTGTDSALSFGTVRVGVNYHF
ncbi:porin family protein [Rhodopseudomonas boonkerdii]|uniref:outer membrane protein n=1 Tax=Rhodopseudomonas boonkerdii TaxID=475937 RepID=UPI001E3D73B3|nr:outer membrane protein [Rhodopseudomonas boonkerdii]UGV25401.1 porin family protein [Rhodopseudomonas boonkerdii]